MKRAEEVGDQEEVRKAKELLMKLTEQYPEVEGHYWVAAFYSCCAHGFHASGISYSEFYLSTMNMADFYKVLWDENKE